MKIPNKDKQAITKSLLPMLRPTTEFAEAKSRIKGEDLINRGQLRDDLGLFIVREKFYIITDRIEVKVNHERRIREIMKTAKDQEDLSTRLAKYVVDYGSKPEEKTEQ